MPYVARDKTAKSKLRGLAAAPARTVTLTCGHVADCQPNVSNPDRWWCCSAWRRAR